MLSLSNIYTLYFRLYFRLFICLNKLYINQLIENSNYIYILTNRKIVIQYILINRKYKFNIY